MWEHFYTYWLQKDDICYLLVTFKQLQSQLRQRLVAMADFLGVEGLSDQHLDCVVRNAQGHFKRPPKEISPDIYNQTMRFVIDKAVNKVNDMLRLKFSKEFEV